MMFLQRLNFRAYCVVVHSSGRKHSKQEGYSYPLCCRILEVLLKSRHQFHLHTFCVLGSNTTTDSHGNTWPIISGFVVETSSGAVNPASFEMNSRCPDEVVRRIRVSIFSYDPNWQGRLLETYDTHSDAFQIAPACWMPDWAEIASSLNQLLDSDVLFQCSTSPAAEPPHFVENERRLWRYLIENPYWEDTFPKYKPRVFHRTSDGRWSRYSIIPSSLYMWNKGIYNHAFVRTCDRLWPHKLSSEQRRFNPSRF